MDIDISASIVLYKTGSSVKRTIADFLNTLLPVKLFLIDNSPTNNLKHKLAEFLSDTRVEYIFNNANIGFGAAHNIAIRKVQNLSSYHLVLNPDVSFDSGVLENLFNYAESNKGIGLLMPKVVYPDGTLQYLCKLLPTPVDLIFRRFLPATTTAVRMKRFEMRNSGYNKVMEVPYLSGCFMFLRTESLKKIGLFDERFFMYPEDIDLTRRMHQDYKTVFYPEVRITHAHEKESYKSLRLLFIHIMNMIRYFNKWGWFFDKERKAINKHIQTQFK